MGFRRVLSVILCSFVLTGTFAVAAQEATPVPVPDADGGPVVFVLNDHATADTDVDLGEPGPSIGDMRIWGPSPLFDEANETDTGATSRGFCVWFTATGDCLLNETIVFPDGSTLEIQGIQPATPMTSIRTIVGGSGQYLGASGVVTVEPAEDLSNWKKTFEIWL